MSTLAVDDGQLWYEDRGDGRPIVFLHGAWMNGDAWDAQWERFGDDYRVVRLDIRGHGRSGGSDRRRYSVGLFADDLERLVAHLGLDAPIVCGLSLGNIITQEYLDRHPTSVAATILGGPARSMPPVDMPRAVKRLGPPPGIETSLYLVGSRATFRTMVRWIRTTTGGPWIAADPAVRAMAIEAAGEVPRAEFKKIYRALYRYDPPSLTHVQTPALAIYGHGESALVKRQGRQVVADVGDGTVASIPEAAHLVNLDNPTAFNERVATFLAERGLAG
jgi:pimeloyl-ACP methyl ester carboxylesterase